MEFRAGSPQCTECVLSFSASATDVSVISGEEMREGVDVLDRRAAEEEGNWGEAASTGVADVIHDAADVVSDVGAPTSGADG